MKLIALALVISRLGYAHDLEGIDGVYDCQFSKRNPVQLISVDRKMPSGDKVEYQYCSAVVNCYSGGKWVGHLEVQTEPTNGFCPKFENWPRKKPTESEHLKAELHPSANYQQVDEWGRECTYIYKDKFVSALYWKNDAAEEGWDTHCLNQVGCRANAKKGKEVRWAACPTVGYRVLADGYHKYPLCEGPVDCIKHSYPMDKAKLK